MGCAASVHEGCQEDKELASPQPDIATESQCQVDEPLSPSIDQNSAAAKMAVRRASKSQHNKNIRIAWFDVEDCFGTELVVEDYKGDDYSASADLARRRASKDKLGLARRLCTGSHELALGETPQYVLDLGVRSESKQRSQSKNSTGRFVDGSTLCEKMQNTAPKACDETYGGSQSREEVHTAVLLGRVP
jgi:hypothetical protein